MINVNNIWRNLTKFNDSIQNFESFYDKIQFNRLFNIIFSAKFNSKIDSKLWNWPHSIQQNIHSIRYRSGLLVMVQCWAKPKKKLLNTMVSWRKNHSIPSKKWPSLRSKRDVSISNAFVLIGHYRHTFVVVVWADRLTLIAVDLYNLASRIGLFISLVAFSQIYAPLPQCSLERGSRQRALLQIVWISIELM